MPALIRIDQTMSWQSYGPLAANEVWQCRDGAMLLTLEDPADENQGIDMRARDTFTVPAGKTVRVLGNALISREVLDASLSPIAGIVKAGDTVHTPGDTGVLVQSVRGDTDTPFGANGDYAPLKTDALGRLKVSAAPATFPLVTGAITAAAQSVFAKCNQASNVVIFMVAAGLVGHNVSFEGSLNSTDGQDGDWFGIQAVRTNANIIESASGVLAATQAYAWETAVNGLSYVRVRATAHTSGTATYQLQLGAFATEPIPAVQVAGVQPVSGTVTASIAAGIARMGFKAAAGIWYDDSVTALAANATFTGVSRDLTVTPTATAWANAATYAHELRVSAEADVAGTLWLEVSRDNVAWRRVKSVATAAVVGGGQSAEIIHRPSWRYARVGFTNGATLQTRFTIGSYSMAA